jgi:hypothetical protein
MRRHFTQAIVCSIGGLGLSVAALFVFLGPPASAGGAGEAIGRLFAMSVIAAAVCAWLAGQGGQPWTWAKFAAAYALACVVLLFLAASGRARAAGDEAMTTIAWPSGWTLRHLEGLSSRPEDQPHGWRERAVLGEGSVPDAAIELACQPSSAEGPVDDAFAGLVDGLAASYHQRGFDVDVTAPVAAHIGGRPALTATLTAAKGAQQVRQDLAMTRTAHCLAVLTFSARPAEYARYRSVYLQVVASLR